MTRRAWVEFLAGCALVTAVTLAGMVAGFAAAGAL
jgi:hypothetical protein